MTLRLIEVIIPAVTVSRLQMLLEDHESIGVWTLPHGDNQAIARILIPTGQTEHLSDALNDHFGMHPEFRLLLFSVEATLPQPHKAEEEEPEPEAEAAESSEEQQQSKTLAHRISREELYQDVARGADISPVYLITVVLSTVVAAVGLLRGDVAVIIGAMVIAPLLGPNVALALASTLGDLSLVGRSVKTLLAGILTAWGLALLIGLLLAVDPTVPEIAARTRLNLSDILLALAAGSAGALAFTSGIPAAVIGVMVAVALLPPLVVTGLLVGAGHSGLGLNALALFFCNIACINLAGIGTFLAQKIRPRSWWESENAGKATRIAVVIWVSMLALLLAVILLTGV